jgi:cation:H+ antiporter
MAYLQVIGGLTILVIAGDFLVRGSVSLAQRLGISNLAVGLTVVAFGTSAPELMVGIDAVITHAPTVAIGNIVGSNIANVWLVVGAPVVFAPMYCSAPKFPLSMVLMVAISVMFIVVAQTMGAFDFRVGIVFIILLAIFIRYASRSKETSEDYGKILADIESSPGRSFSLKNSIGLTTTGIVGLAIGAHILVQGGVAVAIDLGVGEAVIGLTVIALGTSIPELVTATVAAFRGHCDVAVGNVVGSNIFNILGIIGISSFFGTIPIPKGILQFDLWVMLFAALTLLPFALFRITIGRKMGFLYLALYAGYIFILGRSVSTMHNIYSMGVAQ